MGLKGIGRRDDYYTGVGPPYEQPSDIVNRVLAFFEKRGRRHAGQDVLAVTHGDVIIFTMIWARGLPFTAENKVNPHAFGFKRIPATAPDGLHLSHGLAETKSRKCTTACEKPASRALTRYRETKSEARKPRFETKSNNGKPETQQ